MPVIRSKNWEERPDYLIRKLMPDTPMPENSWIRKWGVDTLKPGVASDLHYHDCDEWWIVFAGRARVESAEGTTEVGPGDMLFTPAGERHRITAIEATTLAWIEGPIRSGGREGHLH